MMSCKPGVSRSDFYANLSHWLSAQPVDDVLTDRTASFHEASEQTYAAPRIHTEPADENVHIDCKRIEN